MYSPAAMAKAPARRPATPASTPTSGSGLAHAPARPPDGDRPPRPLELPRPDLRLLDRLDPEVAEQGGRAPALGRFEASIEVDGGEFLVEALPDGVGVESPHAGSSEQVRAAP